MNITEEDIQRQLSVIESTYEMYEKTKKETAKNMKSKVNSDGVRFYSDDKIQDTLKTIETAQEELVEKYVMFGGDVENLKKKSKKTSTKKTATKRTTVDDDDESIKEVLKKKEEKKERMTEYNEEEYYVEDEVPTRHSDYDKIPLPSKGQCYSKKKESIPVAYLTAYDENMIIAPNLYRDNKILDVMLKEKVLSNEIDPGDMIEGDREAIILFLRATGYGNEYPITATDGATGKEFETVIDLSELKYKEFNLVGDENGWFDFKLPVSKKNIKFKFLTHNDILALERREKIEDKRLMKNKINEIIKTLDDFIENDENVERNLKAKVRQSIRTIESWEEEMEEDDALDFTHIVTNRLEKNIMSVDGITDRKMIRAFVKNMNVRDASALRKYITANEPGIDYNITIEKPESLGGGSMTVFLQLDQYIFLNVPE